jgi:hypothetical protein
MRGGELREAEIEDGKKREARASLHEGKEVNGIMKKLRGERKTYCSYEGATQLSRRAFGYLEGC